MDSSRRWAAKLTLALAAAVVFAHLARAQADPATVDDAAKVLKLENGFYLYLRVNENQSIRWDIDQSGQKIFIGEKKELAIIRGELFSLDNANTRYHLSLTVPFDRNIETSRFVLAAGGTLFRQTGSGATGEETSSLSFYIVGEEEAAGVSEFLNIPLRKRRHPRHNFLVSFTPSKPEFKAGDEVKATFRIINVGDSAVAFMKGGMQRAPRDNQYIFSARLYGQGRMGAQVDDIGHSEHHGGLAYRHILKPGDIFEDTVSLNKWFSFEEPGTYRIHGSYYLPFMEPETDDWRAIWEDYVSADFSITVRKAE